MPDYFTLEEFRSLPHMSDATRYDQDRIDAAEAYIVGVFEREVGTAFLTRTITAEIHDGGRDVIVLLVAYGYFAYTFTRRAHAQKIGGTGLILPTF